eukprot:5380176-Pleurochrysis_carterae.AAC.1
MRALRVALDALGAAGAAFAAREARSFRAAVGVPATVSARGTFMLQALRAAAALEADGDGTVSPSRHT